MENKDSPTITPSAQLNLWLSPDLRATWPVDYPGWSDDEASASWKLTEQGQQLQLVSQRRVELVLPHTSANLKFIADYVIFQAQQLTHKDHHTDTVIQDLANLASPLFFGEGLNVDIRAFLDKIANTISLKNGLDGLFRLKWFQNHSPGILLVHQKGEAKAWQIGAGNEDSGVTRTIDIENFNQLLASVKKTKTGQYTTQTPRWNWLPFSGAFLAESFSFKNFNAVLLATRQEFLNFAAEEVVHFHHFAGLLGLWLEDLIEGEFSDLRLAEVMLLLERSPLPVIIKDSRDWPIFTNATYLENEPASLQWIPLGRGYNLGLGVIEVWNNDEIDVLHRHKISLLGDLFNTLGHELSNPLFGLGLAADLLISNSTDEDSGMMLNEIQKNIKRCQLIIQNLTRLYADQDQAGVCDLKNVIKEAITLAKSELKGVRQVLSAELKDNTSLMVEGRPVLIVQILFNLLVNSAQAMTDTTKSPHITIALAENETTVFVDVVDNGPGLPQPIRESLFKPFATTKAKGHGIGLTLSRNLALKAGGDLDSLNPEMGAAFRLTLKKVRA